MNHAYEPDPLSLEGDCRICGLNIPHPEPAGGPLDDVPEAVLLVCEPGCGHVRHDGRACDVTVVVFPTPVACGCLGRVAA